MKKTIALLLCLIFAFTLVACNGGTKPQGIDTEEEDKIWISKTSDSYGTVEITGARDAYNMLTGEYDMAADRAGLRPYCVSVNNITTSWPQKGIASADVTIEMETEGGITRLMCLFSDTREVELIGSVRSLRDQFIEAIYPVDPIVVHIGTSIFADKALAEHNLRSLDGNVMPSLVWFDRVKNQSYATEHCSFTSGELIHKALQDKGFKEESTATIDSYFNFAEPDETIIPDGGVANTVNFLFSGNGYDGDFRYDEASGKYLKWQAGKMQVDAGTEAGGAQVAYDNVFVLFANITNRPDAPELVNVDYQAGGKGYYISNGHYVEITWSKGDYSNPFEFKLADGSDLVVNTGKSIMCFTRTSNEKTLKIA